MPELLLAPIAENIMNKLIDIITHEIGLAWGLNGDLKELQQNLANIQVVLQDAEKKQVKDESVKLWLRDLKDVAYDADDILDEFTYEALRRKLEIPNSLMNKVQNFFSPSSNILAFRLKMAHKIKNINQMLDDIARDMDRFKFTFASISTRPETIENRQTTSIVDESEVFGRENDKSVIVDMLINSNNQEIVSIIPIVGLGGLGKTTLAQLVYNDKLVLKHFDLKMWVCVSDDFGVGRLLKQIIESITGSKCDDISNMDVMARNLREKLSGKRYLLVLDDVWNEDREKWDRLKTFLKVGVDGSKIIVTTRSNKVASIMGTLSAHSLQNLSEDECWSLFKRRAFGIGGAKETPYLVAIGKDIVKKCGGLPLAVKTLGGLLHSKMEEHQWLSIRDSEIWDLPKDENHIMPALMLSYDHLPSQLKQCFSYCSIFPKDYEINIKTLIQLWMAEGFLQPSNENELMEDIGQKYFNILLLNSFFQDVQRNVYDDVQKCKMHDLVHDLAKSISLSECSIVEATSTMKNIFEVRHIRFIFTEEISAIQESIYEAKKLRTFVLQSSQNMENVINNTLMKFKCLRVLDLSESKIKELPSSIGKLKHLRYFDLSFSHIEVLPKSISSLYNLQTLKLNFCYKLEEIAIDIGKLINLRHVTFSTFSSDKQPREIGRLTCLQTLTAFHVGEDSGYEIRELGCLDHLGGELNIHYLDKVRNGIDAKGANLQVKQNIRSLGLHWFDKGGENNNHYEVLEGLQPHPNLKMLMIDGFNGVKFPTWMNCSSYLRNLVEITLEQCNRCEHLPTLGHLPSLKVLRLDRMDVVKRLGCEFYGGSSSSEAEARQGLATVFPSLKQLWLDQMPNLEEWVEPVLFPLAFPCLEDLSIVQCPKLTITPSVFPSLKKLNLRNSNEMTVNSVTSKLTSLTSLHIKNIPELMCLPQGLLQNNNLLRHLEVYKCPKLQAFPNGEFQFLTALEELEIGEISEELDCFRAEGMQHLVSLQRFSIRGWSKLNSLPDQLQHLTTLRELTIENFNALVALPEWLKNLSSLSKLEIRNCENLMYLPEGMQQLTALRCLYITSCPLKERCAKDSGEDWYKISHIPEIRFY